MDKLITNKQIEVDQWKIIASSSSANSEGERVQSSGNQQKMADAVARYVDIQAEINADIDRLVDLKREIISVIEQLDAISYDILHKVYIQFKRLDEVAEEYEKTYSWVTTQHGRALAQVQKIIDRMEGGDSDAGSQ